MSLRIRSSVIEECVGFPHLQCSDTDQIYTYSILSFGDIAVFSVMRISASVVGIIASPVYQYDVKPHKISDVHHLTSDIFTSRSLCYHDVSLHTGLHYIYQASPSPAHDPSSILQPLITSISSIFTTTNSTPSPYLSYKKSVAKSRTMSPNSTLEQSAGFSADTSPITPQLTTSVDLTNTASVASTSVQGFAGPVPLVNPWWDVHAKSPNSKCSVDEERQRIRNAGRGTQITDFKAHLAEHAKLDVNTQVKIRANVCHGNSILTYVMRLTPSSKFCSYLTRLMISLLRREFLSPTHRISTVRCLRTL